MMKAVYLEDVLLHIEAAIEQDPEFTGILTQLMSDLDAIPPVDAWRYLELGHEPKVGEPVQILRRKNMDEPLRVEQGILLPSGKWKSFGHTFEPDNVIAWQPLAPAPELVTE